MPFIFRNDQPDKFLTLLREVGQWLIDNDQELWAIDTLTAENLFDEYTQGNCYVMYMNETSDSGVPAAGTPAATFILQWKDPLYYPDVPDNTTGFIHKVAIRRAFVGQGLFAHILDFCQTRCEERGIHEIQLETDATRPKLMQFYEQNGFRPTYQRQIQEFGQSFRCQYYVMTF